MSDAQANRLLREANSELVMNDIISWIPVVIVITITVIGIRWCTRRYQQVASSTIPPQITDVE